MHLADASSARAAGVRLLPGAAVCHRRRRVMGGASARRELKFGEQRIQTRKFIKFDESVGDPGRGRETMLSRNVGHLATSVRGSPAPWRSPAAGDGMMEWLPGSGFCLVELSQVSGGGPVAGTTLMLRRSVGYHCQR
ncbi:unnamed protein product [Gadus morhua 'NCC']